MGRAGGPPLWVGLALALVATGCSSAIYMAWPQRKVVDHTERVLIEVDSEPAGATIVRDGVVIGTAPVIIEVPYQLTRTYKVHSRRRGAIGCVADLALLGVASYLTYQKARHPDPGADTSFWSDFRHPEPYLLAAGVAAAVTCMVTVKRGPPVPFIQVPVILDERVSPGEAVIEARWPGWPSARTQVVGPGTRSVILRRPELGFDGVLVEWAQRSGRAPSPEGMYRLGLAETRFLDATGDGDHAARAVAWFERYLATEGVPVDRRAEVEGRIGALRARGGR